MDENKYSNDNEIIDDEIDKTNESYSTEITEEQEINSVNEDLDINDDLEVTDANEIEDNDNLVESNNTYYEDDDNEASDEEYVDSEDDEAYEEPEDSSLPTENKEKIEALILENHNLKNQIDVLNTKIDNLESKFMANEAKIIEDANNYYHLKLTNYERKNPRGATKLAIYGRTISIVSFVLSILCVSAYISLSLFKSTNPDLFTTIIDITTYVMYALIGISALALAFAVFGIIFGKRKGVAIATIIFVLFTIGLIITILFTPAKDSILSMQNNKTA